MTRETEALRSVAMTGAPFETGDALDDRGVVFEPDAGAEPGQFLHMHESVLEDRLLDARSPLGARHQGHELGLQIGRKAGERIGRHVDRFDARAVASDAHALRC